MAQQMVNGSHYDGSVTITHRMSKQYAVIGVPFQGQHLKPQDPESLRKRKTHWSIRNTDLKQRKRSVI